MENTCWSLSLPRHGESQDSLPAPYTSVPSCPVESSLQPVYIIPSQPSLLPVVPLITVIYESVFSPEFRELTCDLTVGSCRSGQAYYIHRFVPEAPETEQATRKQGLNVRKHTGADVVG